MTFEICMGGALAVVGKNPGKRGYGSKYHAIWRVFEYSCIYNQAPARLEGSLNVFK